MISRPSLLAPVLAAALFSGCTDEPPTSLVHAGAVPLSAVSVPASPASAAASSEQIDVAWSAVPGASGYSLQRRTRVNGEWTRWSTVYAGPETGFGDGALVPESQYQHRVRACDASGCSAYSGLSGIVTTPAAPSSAPAAPASLTAELSPSGEVVLRWTDASTNESRFIVSRSASPPPHFGGEARDVDTLLANRTTAIDRDVREGYGYTYTVRACNAAGCSGSAAVQFRMTETSVVTAEALAADRVRVRWPIMAASRYQVQRRHRQDGVYSQWRLVADVPTSQLRFVDTLVQPATTYEYRVNLVQARPERTTTPAAPASAPPVPGDARETAISASEILVGWTDASTDESRFDVERRVRVPGAWSDWLPVGRLLPGDTLHRDTTVLPRETYQYRVRACNLAGCSPFALSSEPVPAAPVLYSAHASASWMIPVFWQDVAGETRYALERRTRQGETWGEWAALAGLAGGVARFNDVKVTANTTYEYRVQACNTAGCSAFSNHSGPVVTPTEVIPPGPPRATASAASPRQLNVAWADAPNEGWFELERRTRSNGSWSAWAALATVPANRTRYEDTGLEVATRHEYQVRACNTVGCSPFSASGGATTQLEFSMVTSGEGHSCGLTPEGVAYCWGNNSRMNTHLGAVPTRVAGGHTFSTISAGLNHTLALTPSGKAYAWGWGRYGQLGRGRAYDSSSVPVEVLGGHRFSAISAGEIHSVALTPDGALYMWGGCEDDFVAPCEISDELATPRNISYGHVFSAISAGTGHTAALDRNGAAYIMGVSWIHSYGALLNAPLLNPPLVYPPRLVPGGRTFSSVSAGNRTLGLTANGEAYSLSSSTGSGPVRVAEGLAFQSVSACRSASRSSACGFVLGVTTAGAVYAWGDNTYGQLGDGTTISRAEPVQVAGGQRYRSVSAGAYHSVAITADGGGRAWGANGGGRLGNGSGPASSVPVVVSGPAIP